MTPISKITEKCGAVKAYVSDGVWEADDASMPRCKRFGVRALRFFQATFSGFSRHSRAFPATAAPSTPPASPTTR